MQPLASQGSSRAASSSRHTVPLRAIEFASCWPPLDASLGTSLQQTKERRKNKLLTHDTIKDGGSVDNDSVCVCPAKDASRSEKSRKID